MADLATLGRPALGGGPLLGDKILRMAFLDEAGIGNPRDEPYVVVAGVVLHADKQWQAIEKRLEELWYEYMPDDCPNGYAFHATELFSGGKVFDRKRYPKEVRWAILDKLVAIPAEFNLPVVATYVPRTELPDVRNAHMRGFMTAAATVEQYMRLLPDRSEVAMLILEDNHLIRDHVRDMQNAMRDPRYLQQFGASQRDAMWLTRIMGQPHFEPKSAMSPLQIADVCAFVTKRRVMEKADAERFFDPLRSQFIAPTKARTDQDERERPF
jgi:hypothetical protein